jgi:hypothetical protein
MSHLLYTSHLPQPEGTTVATSADDTVLMAVGGDVTEATAKLQAGDEIHNWSRQWLIKLNEDKLTCKFHHQKVSFYTNSYGWQTISYSQAAKYPGMTLDAKLRWTVHVKKKREELDLKYKHELDYGKKIGPFDT